MRNTVAPNIQPDQIDIIQSVGKSLLHLRSELYEIFPEREWLINQIIMALLTGKNVLIWGLPGTAKSYLAKLLFESIVGPGIDNKPKQVFSIQIDNETTKVDLIGPPDLKGLENHGDWEHKVEGYLPTADFAYIDEVLDGPAVLRGLNDILNEHELREGKQHIQVPLLTALATSNRSFEQIIEMHPQLDLNAFADRFLFVSVVDYLQEEESQDTMISNYLMGTKLNATVMFRELQQAVEIIQNTNQFPDESFVKVFREVIIAYKTKLNRQHGKTISDRRLNWLTQIVEAQAVLMGRANLFLEDILAAAYGLCDSNKSAEYRLFQDTATPIIEKAKKEMREKADEAAKSQLERIRQDILSLEKQVEQQSWPPNTGAVGNTLQKIAALDSEIFSVVGQLESTEVTKQNHAKRLKTLQNKVANTFKKGG